MLVGFAFDFFLVRFTFNYTTQQARQFWVLGRIPRQVAVRQEPDGRDSAAIHVESCCGVGFSVFNDCMSFVVKFAEVCMWCPSEYASLLKAKA